MPKPGGRLTFKFFEGAEHLFQVPETGQLGNAFDGVLGID